jgi:hypothetical protein
MTLAVSRSDFIRTESLTANREGIELMRIIKRSERGTSVSYCHEYGQDWNGNGRISLCSGFDCDPMGVIDVTRLMPAALNNLRECRAGMRDDGTKVYDLGVQKREHHYYQPAVGECVHCKRHVTLGSFTNTCLCGADYNMSGQLLAHRSQWGEETGETADDILRYNY